MSESDGAKGRATKKLMNVEKFVNVQKYSMQEIKTAEQGTDEEKRRKAINNDGYFTPTYIQNGCPTRFCLQ